MQKLKFSLPPIISIVVFVLCSVLIAFPFLSNDLPVLKPTSISVSKTNISVQKKVLESNFELSSALFERPLFTETRRVPEKLEVRESVPEVIVDIEPEVLAVELAPIEEELEIEPPIVAFRGVLRLGDSYSALLSHNGTESWLSVDQKIAGWSIDKITSTAVDLSNGSQTISVAISE